MLNRIEELLLSLINVVGLTGSDGDTILLPSEFGDGCADSASVQRHWFTFLDVHRGEAFDKFRCHHLFALDDNEAHLEGCFASLVATNAANHTRIAQTGASDHERMIARLVYENFVRSVVVDLTTVQVPRHVRVRPTGDTAIESYHLTLTNFLVGRHADKLRRQSFG